MCVGLPKLTCTHSTTLYSYNAYCLIGPQEMFMQTLFPEFCTFISLCSLDLKISFTLLNITLFPSGIKHFWQYSNFLSLLNQLFLLSACPEEFSFSLKPSHFMRAYLGAGWFWVDILKQRHYTLFKTFKFLVDCFQCKGWVAELWF